MQYIVIIISTISGGAISIFTTWFNNRALKQNRILEEKLSIYREVSRTIIEEKLAFEVSLGEIAKMSKKEADNKTGNGVWEKSFNEETTRLSASIHKIYSLFTYSYILEGQTIQKLNELYSLLAQTMDPSTMSRLRVEDMQKIGQAFENVVSSLSESLGIIGIKRPPLPPIDNPNKLINEAIGKRLTFPPEN